MKTIFVGPQGIRAPYRTVAERVLPRARVAYQRPAWNGGESTGVAYPPSYVSRFCAGLCDVVRVARRMDRYNAAKDRRCLLKSRDLYRQAFETASKDFYTRINAATKSLLLDEQQTAQQLAQRVEQLVGTKAVPGKYWETASVAEVQLLQGHFAEAGQLYQAAVVAAPAEIGSHQTTCNQALLILDHLNAAKNDRTSVLRPFARLANPVRSKAGLAGETARTRPDRAFRSGTESSLRVS